MGCGPNRNVRSSARRNEAGYIDARAVSTGSTKTIFAPDNKPIEVFTGSSRLSLRPIACTVAITNDALGEIGRLVDKSFCTPQQIPVALAYIVQGSGVAADTWCTRPCV